MILRKKYIGTGERECQTEITGELLQQARKTTE
jgi:hypothetical protein